jgi:hypothetical protein
MMIEDCLKELMVKQGVIVLPVHDELLCPADKVDIVFKQMVSSYRKSMRLALIQKKLLTSNDPLPDYIKPIVKDGDIAL